MTSNQHIEVDIKNRSLTKLLNFLNTVAVVTTVSYIPFYYLVKNFYFVPIQSVTAVLVSFSFYFVKRGWYAFSSYWVILILTAAITWATFVTPDVGVELLLIPISVVLISLFENKINAVILFVIIFITYLVLEIMRPEFPRVVEYPQEIKQIVYYMNISVIFIVSFVDVRYYWKWSKEAQQKLIEEKEKNYDLEINKKQKSLDLTQANNQMKAKFRQNMIQKLENAMESPDLRNEVAGIIMDFKNQSAVDSKIDYKENHNRDHGVFESRLTEKYPTLSKSEKEICVYLKLDLSSKEIANLRGSTVNTIDVTKNRIRKKLDIKSGESISDFLKTI